MAGILESLAAGLRQAGGVLNPAVQGILANESSQDESFRQRVAMQQLADRLAQERQQASPEYQAKLEAIGNERKLRQALIDANGDTQKIRAAYLQFGPASTASKILGVGESEFAKLNPGDFTPESIDKYRTSGNKWDLRRAATPNAILSHDMAAARLRETQRQWDNLSPYQRETLAKDAAAQGKSALQLLWETGQTAPVYQPGPAVYAPAPAAQAPSPIGTAPVSPQPPADAQTGPVSDPMMDRARLAKMTPDQLAMGLHEAAVSVQQYPNDPSHRQAYATFAQAARNRGINVNVPIPPQGGAAVAPQAGTTDPVLAPRPGSAIPPKDRAKIEAERPQAAGALRNVTAGVDRMMTNIEQLENAPGLFNILGPVASYTPNLSKDANDAQALLDTLKSQIGVQVLTAMREASKTGGAVGNVTEKEWPILQNQLAALQQTQSEAQFKKKLGELKETLRRMKSSSQQVYRDTYGNLPADTGGELTADEQAELESLRKRLKK
jgi:hypothetical protein